MPVEVELKFRADGPETLDRLAAVTQLGDASLGPAEAVEEVDRYLDTDDRRLAAAGWACRLRRRDGMHRLSMKGPPEARVSGPLHRRPELEGPAVDHPDPGRWPESDARRLLDELRGALPLRERFRLHQIRRERSVSVDGEPLGTLTLDEVEILAGGRRRGTLQVVELEIRDAGPAQAESTPGLDAVFEGLRTFGGLEPEPLTKLEHALTLIGE